MRKVSERCIWILVAVALVAGQGCVSRNVEDIGSDEAAAIPAPQPTPSASAPGATAAPSSGATPSSGGAQTQISGTVEIATELAAQIPSNATLFLVVRIAGREGGPPLAVQRHSSPTFPLQFVISEADSMVPNTPLVGELSINARIDLDGNAATTSAGDLSGVVGPVQAGNAGVVLLISEVEPGQS
jgi:hypothetical protein